MSQRSTLLILLLAGSASIAWAGYLPLWLQQDNAQVIIDGASLGPRWIQDADSARTMTFAVRVDRILYQQVGSELPLVPADTLLLEAKGTFMGPEDRGRFLVFGLVPPFWRDRSEIVLRGQAMPCDRFLPMFTRKQWDCGDGDGEPADACGCALDAIARYGELREARSRDRESEFLLGALEDRNPVVVAGAMGLLRMKGDPSAMEAMAPLAHHAEMQIRYDLAESIPYLAGDVAGRVGIELLDDPESTVQLVAAFGLGRIRHRGAEARLAEVLKDPRRDRMVRASCLDALGKMDSPLLLPALEVAVASEPDSATAAGLRMHLDRLHRMRPQSR